MPEQIRRKKKSSKTKPQKSSSGLFLGIAGAVVIVGVVIAVAVSRSRGNANSAVTPGTTNSSNPTAASGNTSSTDATTAQDIHVPMISPDALPLQDEPTVDEKGRFDLRLPIGWKREPDQQFHVSPDMEKIERGPEFHRQPGMTVLSTPQLTRTLQSLGDEAREPYRKANLPILADQPTRISGYDARRYIFESDVSQQLIDAFGLTPGEKYRTLYYIVGPVNDTFLLVIMQAHNDNGRFEKLLPTFEAMMSTFRIPAAGGKRE